MTFPNAPGIGGKRARSRLFLCISLQPAGETERFFAGGQPDRAFLTAVVNLAPPIRRQPRLFVLRRAMRSEHAMLTLA